MGSSYPEGERVMPKVAVQQREAQSSTQLSDFKKVRVRWLKEDSGWESPPTGEVCNGDILKRQELDFQKFRLVLNSTEDLAAGTLEDKVKFSGLHATLSGVFCLQHIVVLSRSRVEYWSVMLSINQQTMSKPRYFAYLLTALWRSVRYDTFIQTRERTRMMHHFKNNYKKLA